MIDLSTLSLKILNILKEENATSEGITMDAGEIASMMPLKTSTRAIADEILVMRKNGLVKMVQIVGIANFFITEKGIAQLSMIPTGEPKKLVVKKAVKNLPAPTEKPTQVIGELVDVSEKEKVLSGAMKSDNVDVIALVTEINQLKDELELISAENSRLNAENVALLCEIVTLKQSQPPSALWIQEQDPTAEYAISSAYMQRRPSLEELLQRAEAETVKHAKPRTIYQIKKLGVMTPNVTAEFKGA